MLAVQEDPGPFIPMYADNAKAADKIRAVAKTVYGADDVVFTQTATRSLRRFAKRGWSDLPICMAKTPSSLSDTAKLRGRPTGFTVTVKDVLANTGAGFLVALLGEVSRMPGLPRRPAALDVDLDGVIHGVE
jgi:formate--tetrahydrofolate ligase